MSGLVRWMVVAMLIVMVAGGGQVLAATYTWDDGGTGSDWGTAENWNSGDIEPTAADSAYVGDASLQPVATANITAAGEVANNLNIASANNCTGIVNMVSGTLDTAGVLTLGGRFSGHESTYGEFNLSDGVLNVGDGAAEDLSVGHYGIGLFTQSGGTNIVHDDLWCGYQGAAARGTYTMTGGLLQIGTSGTECQLYMARNGYGRMNLYGGRIEAGAMATSSIGNGPGGIGVLMLGNAAGTCEITRTGAAAGDEWFNVGYGTATGLLQGWGDFPMGGPTTGRFYINAGRIVADGYGISRTLSITNFSDFWNTVDNTTTNGVYAVNAGCLEMIVDINPGSTEYWAEDDGPDLVNAARMSSAGIAGTGRYIGRLYHEDHTDVPAIAGDVIGIWNFTRTGTLTVTDIDFTFRYDMNAVTALGLTEANLKVFVNNDGNGNSWTEAASQSIDTANDRITLNALTDISATSFIAVGIGITDGGSGGTDGSVVGIR